MKIIIFKGTDSQWYWRIEARNGQPLATSEGYTRKDSARKTAKRVKENLAKAMISLQD